MQFNVREVEVLAAEQIVQSLQEIRDNIREMGRDEAMSAHVQLQILMMAMNPEAVAVMNTILAFKLAELTAQRDDS